MGTEMTAEMVAAGDANETTPSDTPLRKLISRQTPPLDADGAALRRVLELAERLIQERRAIQSHVLREVVEVTVANILGALGLTMVAAVAETPPELRFVGLILCLFAAAFMILRFLTLRGWLADRRRNERLAGKAVEFVREYTALTRSDRSPVEEAELQLRLDQIGIESLDRPM
jgi:hypothetical protein